jgi:hypothetical protein
LSELRANTEGEKVRPLGWRLCEVDHTSALFSANDLRSMDNAVGIGGPSKVRRPTIPFDPIDGPRLRRADR